MERGVAYRLLDRRGQRLLRPGVGLRTSAQEIRQGRAASDEQRQHPQCARPVQAADQHLSRGHHGKLTERAASAGDAHRRAAVGGRNRAGHHGQDHRKGRAGLAQSDQHAGRQIERGFIRGEARAYHAQHVQQRAQRDGAARTVAVGHDAHEDTGHAPHQVLQSEGHGEHFASPALRQPHRLHEEPEGGAHPHREQHHQRTHDQGTDEIRIGLVRHETRFSLFCSSPPPRDGPARSAGPGHHIQIASALRQ